MTTRTHSDPEAWTPLVSVIIPAHQASKTICDTLKSVLNQTYSNFEIILVDDGSTDDTVAKVAKFQDSRLRLVSQDNQGVSVARNHGFSLASGEYIAFLDADDAWFPDKLAVDLETVTRNPDPVCLVYSGFYCVDDRYRITNIPKSNPINREDFFSVLNTMLIPSNTLLHRRVMESLGGFPHNSECYAEDRVFFLKACLRFPAYPTGKRLVLYRQVSSGRALRLLLDYELAVRTERAIIESLRRELPDDAYEAVDRFHTRSLLNRFLRFNHLDSARRYAMEVPCGLLIRDPKGVLSILSLATGVNFLYYCQEVLRFALKFGLLPWWVLKRRPALAPLKPYATAVRPVPADAVRVPAVPSPTR